MCDNNARIITMLAYENGVASMDWPREAFGFSGKSIRFTTKAS